MQVANNTSDLAAKILGGNTREWALDESTQEDKLAAVKYKGSFTVSNDKITSAISCTRGNGCNKCRGVMHHACIQHLAMCLLETIVVLALSKTNELYPAILF